ncbi:MAG TPA: glycosyltransferase family 4 protein [Gemmatimonadales bacterium]|jgi:phosphatidylinositol alpha-1,6-mannosyltransferase|nr:glycosyltransferase family 4 protein [Gemmatimonadales bacterium]
MPKTFLLTDEFPPMQTGVARMMGEIARRYPRGELLVSTGQHRDSQDSDVRFAGVALDRLPIPTRALKNLAGLLFWSRRAASLARQHKPRFAWCDSIRPCAYPAKWMHERVGTKYGVIVHGGDLLKELHAIHHSRFARRTAKALLGSAVSVVANSQWTREQAQKVLRELGLDPLAEHVKLVPLGTDPEQFRPGLDPREVRARYRLNGDPWVITVARLETYKGVDTALKAVAECRRGGLDVNYLVVGAGKKRSAYVKLAEDLAIANAVRFVGNVPDQDLPALLNAATAYVGVSRRADGTRVEGFGIALAEASACGLPVIAGRSGGLAEAVHDGETGLVVDPDDPAAVVAALKRLLEDQLLARRLGQAGRKAIETYYNWDRVIRDLRDIESQVSS